MDKQRQLEGRKPVFYTKEDGCFYINVVDRGGLPESLTLTLLLIQRYGVTEETVKITKHYA